MRAIFDGENLRCDKKKYDICKFLAKAIWYNNMLIIKSNESVFFLKSLQNVNLI